MRKKQDRVMRELVLAVGGPLRATENRKAWLARVARAADISRSQARKAFYGLLRDSEHKTAWKLREAVEREKSNKYKRIAGVFNTAAQELAEAGDESDGRLRALALRIARELVDLADTEK